MSGDFYRGKVVMITGASSGIGAALARELAAQGAKLALCARRKGRLETLAGQLAAAHRTEALALECDVTRDGDLERAVDATARKFGAVDMVVANAGFGVVGRFNKLTLDDYRRQFETNVFGVLRSAWAAHAELKKSRGTFAVIGSVMGYLATPETSPYSMSKFSLRALAQALETEWLDDGIRVKYIAPGFVESEIRTIDNRGERVQRAKDRTPAWLIVPADVAARDIARGLRRGGREVVVTGHGKFFVFLQQYFPWLVSALIRKLKIKHREPAQ